MPVIGLRCRSSREHLALLAGAMPAVGRCSLRARSRRTGPEESRSSSGEPHDGHCGRRVRVCCARSRVRTLVDTTRSRRADCPPRSDPARISVAASASAACRIEAMHAGTAAAGRRCRCAARYTLPGLRCPRSLCARHSQHAVCPGTNMGPIQVSMPTGLTRSQAFPEISARAFHPPIRVAGSHR